MSTTRTLRAAFAAAALAIAAAPAARADEAPASTPAPTNAPPIGSGAGAAAPDVPAGPPQPFPDDDLRAVPDVAAIGMGDMLVQLARTVLMLLVVVGLVYLTLHKGLGRLVQKSQSGKRVRVVERVSLDQRRALYLVEVDGRELLLAGGEGGVRQIAETTKQTTTTTTTMAPAPTLAERFTAALAKKPAAAPVDAAKEDA